MATVNVLVVAGGGGGGGFGGGGAGGDRTDATHVVASGSYAITVGGGGTAGTGTTRGGSGGTSTFDTITSSGGGGGGAFSDSVPGGVSGGSGGGGGTDATTPFTGRAGGTGNAGSFAPSEGTSGGTGVTGGTAAGGGGGATSAGAAGSGTSGGAGGAGTANTISGASVTYAGGGGGGGNAVAGAAGSGGGGIGSLPAGAAGAGSANTGGGGGGGYDSAGAAGGSGVVILSYTTGSFIATGGTITTSGGNTIHTFTSNGTFTVLAAFLSIDWPNPRRVVPARQHLSFTAPLNLPLYFYLPPPPFRQGDWPNPVRRVHAPAWQQSVTQSLVIPRDADYFYGLVWIAVNGVARAQGRSGSGSIDFASLSITDELDQTPNTCSFIARGFTPAVGQSVILTLGSALIPNPERIFAGTILQVKQVYAGTPANQTFQVACIDWTWQLNTRKVIKQYSGWSVAAIAIDLIATYAPGFTCNHVAWLGTIDLISFTNVDLTDALTQLAKRAGGYWYVDYTKDLHVFVTEGVTPPTPLTAAHPSLTDFAITRDLSQWITRQYAEGGGGNAAAALSVGDTILPVDVATWYPSTGGQVVCGSQRVTYAGVQLGGGGSLVGPGASPASAPAVVLASGTGLGTGVYQYAYTDITAAGESLPSPFGTITTGLTAAPSAAPTVGAPTVGSGVDAGSHNYEVTFATSTGETTPSPISGSVTTAAAVAVPPSPPPYVTGLGAPFLPAGTYQYALTYQTAAGETVAGASSTLVAPGTHSYNFFSTDFVSADARVTNIKIYRTVAGGAQLKLLTTITNTNGQTPVDDGTATLGANVPTSDSTNSLTVPLTAIPLGDATVTSRKLYRRFNGAGTFKLVTTIANNTVITYTDTTANASLGAAAPSSNTATAQQVAVSGIAIGASPTTSRKLYRTAVGASQLKLLTTLADNTTTTVADSTADGSLGANAPTSDTSALTQPTGQVLAGATTLLVAGAGAFAASGGWAIIGNGQQVIRYTGITGNTLTGIPATGNGAITATVSYNSTVTVAAALTGIPASGSGAIVYAIPAGAPVNLLAQVDDLAGQTALAALIGGDGVQEAYVQDGRIAYTEALARATARQALNNAIREAIAYVVRDPQTGSGKTIVVNLVAPTSVTASYKIQRVTITQFSAAAGLFPTYTAEASSDKVSFENALATLIAKGRATP